MMMCMHEGATWEKTIAGNGYWRWPCIEHRTVHCRDAESTCPDCEQPLPPEPDEGARR